MTRFRPLNGEDTERPKTPKGESEVLKKLWKAQKEDAEFKRNYGQSPGPEGGK